MVRSLLPAPLPQVKSLNKEERTERLAKIQEMFQKAREYSDDKVQIAMQMYEMVSIWMKRGRDKGKSECGGGVGGVHV